MTIRMFPIKNRVNISKFVRLKKILQEIEPGDNLVSYISSFGGDAKYMSLIAGTIDNLPIKKITYAGERVYSSAAVIFCAYDERIGFQDSKFIIHRSIPQKGRLRDENFEKFDMQFLKFMQKRMRKISLPDLVALADEGKIISAQKALEIGLIHKIIPNQASEKNFVKQTKTATV